MSTPIAKEQFREQVSATAVTEARGSAQKAAKNADEEEDWFDLSCENWQIILQRTPVSVLVLHRQLTQSTGNCFRHTNACARPVMVFDSFNQEQFHNPMNKFTFSLLQTSGSAGPLVLRVFLGIVMFPHGAQKVLGWFGGAGFAASLAFFDRMHIPAIFAIFSMLTEFLGPIALFLGFLTRLTAFAIGFDMLVAALLVHIHFGFFMNWLGKQKGEGVEFDLLLWAIAIVLILQGGGAFSLDRAIAAKLRK